MQHTSKQVSGNRFVRYARRVRLAVYGWLDRPAFFYVLVGLLVFQALWIALTARYPQAFDENYHFGLIQLHATQWLPYFTAHIPGAEVYGAITRDPSYLYHFIFSLPYRLLTTFTDSLAIQVIALRMGNIALFVGGLFVYRKVLAELGLSRRLIHVVLLFFVLTPIMPLLAAQINYDNLIFLLTGLLFLYAVRLLQQLDRSGTISVVNLLWVVFYMLLTSIVKYTSTPLSLGLALVLAAVLGWRYYQRRLAAPALQWPRRSVLILLGLAVLILGGLFAERYGTNLVRYGHPVPDCGLVLTTEQCMAYSPWARDHLYADTYPKPTAWGVLVYPGVWVHRMVFETMFTISSRFDYDGVTVVYIPAPPLTVANYTAWTIVTVGAVLTLMFWKRLWRQRYLRWLLLAIGFYTAVLFAKNLSMYLHTGEAMAIHGRYLIPVYPVLYAALALVFGWALERNKRPELKTWLVIATLVLLIHGAGLVVWIFRSDPSWYWSRAADAFVYQVNRPVQQIIHRIIIP
ncbi:MAG TPA: hypothetical protein VK978_02325 [Candidatus Saccharimonadales bacterium]|nr:hypothetical protein [Candidatus Saccharimonadales bacterium]